MASISFAVDTITEPFTENYSDTLHVGVVGDTGVGERAYHPGFIAVAKALKNHGPDLLLHLGDFVYQPKIFPQTCPERYLREIKKPWLTLSSSNFLSLAIMTYLRTEKNQKAQGVGKKLTQWTVI